uniref:Uncharacterized protein n=1 Tax=Globisporangium ultimum (strain ATCC 200006 / CBS 805.95 / DAOM BR144) TaxID=431595 RepID=K3X515_GLOUD
MVLRSFLYNASALALMLVVAASNQGGQVNAIQVTGAAANAHQFDSTVSRKLSSSGRKHKMAKKQRVLEKADCNEIPSSGVTDGSVGNESDEVPVTQKPKKTKTPKPKKTKTPKPTKTKSTPAATTAAPASSSEAATPASSSGGDEEPTATTPEPASADVSASGSAGGSNATTTEAEATTAPAASSGKLCKVPKVTVSEIDVGASVLTNEDEAALKVVAISAKPGGGSNIAFHTGSNVQVMSLDANDKIVAGSTVTVNVVDFADIYSDAKGFVILGTRAATGGGTLNCGNPSNLCGTAPSPAVPCYDMYLIRYEGDKEVWATKLTTSSASLPPYSTSKTGADVYMIWWYAHHGRIAYDGTNWASYFGVAISTSEDGCINIHQGDRMQVVGPTGALVKSANSFDLGCSHSGYERITYDDRSKEFAMICKTDNNNRIKFPNSDTTIYPVDLAASNLGDIVKDVSTGYWMTVSNGDDNDAKVHLMHFAKNKVTDKDIVLGGANANERACHLASIGSGGLLAAWEGSSATGDFMEGDSSRKIYIQVRDAKDGAAVSDAITVDGGIVGNRYQAFKSFPDGSVAYLSEGSTETKLKVLRVAPC